MCALFYHKCYESRERAARIDSGEEYKCEDDKTRKNSLSVGLQSLTERTLRLVVVSRRCFILVCFKMVAIGHARKREEENDPNKLFLVYLK